MLSKKANYVMHFANIIIIHFSIFKYMTYTVKFRNDATYMGFGLELCNGYVLSPSI